MSVKKDLDELINWFEANAPEVLRPIPVCATPNTVRRFAKKTRNGPYLYRGRAIVPIRKTRGERAVEDKQTEAPFYESR